MADKVKFVVVNTTTGNLVRQGYSEPFQITSQAGSGEIAMQVGKTLDLSRWVGEFAEGVWSIVEREEAEVTLPDILYLNGSGKVSINVGVGGSAKLADGTVFEPAGDGVALCTIPEGDSVLVRIDQPGKAFISKTLKVVSLPNYKATKCDEVDAERDNRFHLPLTVGSHIYDGDDKSQENIIAAATAGTIAYITGQTDYSMPWIFADNTSATLTAMEMKAVAEAFGARRVGGYQACRTAKDEILAAGSAEAVDAILAAYMAST